GAPASPFSGARSSKVMVSLMASGAPCILGVQRGDVELRRVLSLVRMFGPSIDAQIAELLTAKRPARDHPLHCLLQHPLGMLAVEDLLGGAVLDAAGITGMSVIDLVGARIAGQHHVAGVDYDDVVAAIKMGRVGGLMFAAKPICDEDREPAHHEALGVDQDPGLLDVLRRG